MSCPCCNKCVAKLCRNVCSSPFWPVRLGPSRLAAPCQSCSDPDDAGEGRGSSLRASRSSGTPKHSARETSIARSIPSPRPDTSAPMRTAATPLPIQHDDPARTLSAPTPDAPTTSTPDLRLVSVTQSLSPLPPRTVTSNIPKSTSFTRNRSASINRSPLHRSAHHQLRHTLNNAPPPLPPSSPPPPTSPPHSDAPNPDSSVRNAYRCTRNTDLICSNNFGD